MKIVFAKQDPATVLDHISRSLGASTLQDMITLDLLKNNGLEVTITKAGTSRLSFSFHENAKEITWKLDKQKLALTHLPFKATIYERLKKAVERQGGKILEA